jgi:TonB-linked SusC/RagA family outer membrane protein
MKKLLLILASMLVAVTVMAQNSEKISIQVSQKPLYEVLSEIQRLSGFNFFYSRDAVAMQKKVNFTATKEPAKAAITRLLTEQGVGFTINGTDVIVLAEPAKKEKVTISGTVIDDMGYPLPGGGVMVAGTQQGVVTDLDGKYSIAVYLPCTLEFSYVGYVTQLKTIGSVSGPIDVKLMINANELKEVVVVGYGTLEKREVTSSITSIKADNLVQGGGGATIATALRGEISGMTISTNSSPNASYGFQLRGVSSINADDSPLVVIDGIPGGHLSSLNQDEIESIDILKDASAGAIYGTRAAGGVILVTTKKAKEGSFKVSYTGEVSTEAVTARPRVLTRERYLKYDIGSDYGYDTDWYGELLNEGAVSHRHSVSMTGGSSVAKIYANFMTQNQKGIALGDGRTDYEGRVNGHFSALNNLLEVDFHTQYLHVKRDIRSSSSQFNQALKLNPTISPYSDSNESGYNVLTGGNDTFNPVADVMLKQNDRVETWLSADASFKLNLPYDIKLNATVGWQNKTQQNTNYLDSHHKTCVDNGYHGSAHHSYSKWSDITTEVTASWSGMIKEHKISAVAGYSFFQSGGESFSMTNYDFVIDGIGPWDMGKGTYLTEGDALMSSSKNSRERLLAFFGRANWAWKDRYLLMASIRHEGSSKFGKNNRWGTFWSLSGGWRISQEPWMKNISWINDLKLRLGYGVTGNNNFSSGVTVPTYSSNSYWIYDGEWVVSYGHSSNVNHDLKWEQKSELNLGIDYSFLNNRLYGKVDLYRRAITGMLYNIRVPQPPAIYEKTTMNYGDLENLGWEVEIGGVPVRKNDFQWSTTLRLSHSNSRITSLWGNNTYSDRVEFPSPGNPGYGGRMEEGTKIGQYYIWKYAGVTEEGKWLIYDKDDNIILADNRKYEDKRYIGDAIPAVIASWSHSFRYKNLSLNINLRSWIDFDVFNTINMYYGLATDTGINVLRSAYIENRHIKQEKVLCDYWLEDGTFLKIDAISLGYTLDMKKWQKIIDNIHFFFTARDVACFSTYSGLNPEVNINGLDAGYEWFTSIYPRTARFTLGAKITF